MIKYRNSIKVTVIIIFLLNYISVYSKNNVNKIDYSINRIITDSIKVRYTVEMSFKGNKSGESFIVIPSKWADAINASHRLKNLEVLNDGIQLLQTINPSELKLIHKPNEKIKIKYEIISLMDDEPSVSGESKFYPVVKRDFIHWIGHTTWVVPLNLDNEFKAELQLNGFPSSWSVGSSFKSKKNKLYFKGSLSEFMSSIVAIGNYRKLISKSKNGLVTVLVQGKWMFDDVTIIKIITETIDAHQYFWNDSSKVNFLATLVPLSSKNNSTSIDGVALYNSFALFSSESMKKNELEKFISHELFHHWLPHSMGQLEQEGQGLSWFVEGFTSYYSLILRYRMNYLNFEEYVMNVNEILYKLATSQLRRTNNKYLVDQFFNDPVASQTLYRRGFLIALKWDQKIRKTYEGKKSLDSVMNLLLTEFTLNPKLKLGEDIITKHMEKFGIIDAKGDIKEMLVGADILSDSDIYNECVELTKKDIEIYDLGFQFEETSTSFDFTSVDDKSQAYENGLRLGQMPMSVEISHGDMNSNVKLKVQDGKEIKEIIFRPFKKQSVPFLKFKNHMEEKSICDLNLLEAK